MITRRPITPQMVEDGARALWEQTQDIEGRLEWDEAAFFVKDVYYVKAKIVLEAAIPQNRKVLTRLRDDIEHTLRIL